LPAKTLIGWREWVSLPELDLPAVKVKVDTGAQTSALHAVDITPYEKDGQRRVRFKTHPMQGNTEIERACDCVLVDEREITSSNGQKETRCVIRTLIERNQIKKSIEVTLTARSDMEFRMLLGRTAMREMEVIVDPNQSFLLGRLDKPKERYRLMQGVLQKLGHILTPEKTS
jgi:hypothetical protein